MLLQCLSTLTHNKVIEELAEVCVFLYLDHVFFLYIFPPLKCNLVTWIRGISLHWISKIQSVHSGCKVICVPCVGDTNISTDLSCCPNVSLGCSFPCPIVDVASESWLPPIKLGLSSSLQMNPLVPLSMLVTAMTSLILPCSGSLLLWARLITLTFIWHDNRLGLSKIC